MQITGVIRLAPSTSSQKHWDSNSSTCSEKLHAFPLFRVLDGPRVGTGEAPMEEGSGLGESVSWTQRRKHRF